MGAQVCRVGIMKGGDWCLGHSSPQRTAGDDIHAFPPGRKPGPAAPPGARDELGTRCCQLPLPSPAPA